LVEEIVWRLVGSSDCRDNAVVVIFVDERCGEDFAGVGGRRIYEGKLVG
jgi:hypothetical protein